MNGRPARHYAYNGTNPDTGQPWEDSRCGTYAGWNMHRRAREDPCRPCKDAAAEYMRLWRLETGRTRTRRVAVSAAELALLRAMRSRTRREDR